MRLLASLFVISFAAIQLTSSTFAHEPGDSVVKKLSGMWEIEEGVNQGEALSKEELDDTMMRIEKNTIITIDKGKKEKYRSTFTIDASTKPISIDMTTMMKGVPPMKSLGILKFEDDDEFEICYALPGADRPTKFESPKGSKNMLFECERED